MPPQILRYAGPCAVCESADRREIDALIRLDKHPMEIYRKHGWVEARHRSPQAVHPRRRGVMNMARKNDKSNGYLSYPPRSQMRSI